MNINLKKEIPLLAIVAIPFIYVAFIWNTLPERIPLHWNINGEIDRWGPKIAIFIAPVLTVLLVYVLFLVIQKIDPKGKIEKMGGKFQTLRFVLTLFMSALSVYIIYVTQRGENSLPHGIFVLVGLLFTALGNFFKTIRPNYFLGIRTPWTLENEAVWKSTHVLAGKLWFVGGLVIALIALLSGTKMALYIMLGIILIITLIPVVYSYTEFRRLKNEN